MESQNSIVDVLIRQKQFFLTGKTKNITYRKEQLRKLRDLIIENEKAIYEALKTDFRKSTFETYLSENGYMIMEINHFIKKLKRWARPKRLPSNLLSFPSSSFLMYEPYGVSLIIAPWNYPFQLAMGPLVGAMAAGNCAILKPSELAPATSALMKKLINDNFDDSYIHVVEGDAKVTQTLLSEEFDYIFFTGGTYVGKIIAEAAAKNLTPVTLELGGKSPCIVDGSMNMKLAARRIVWGKFLNNGQTCVAPDYIYVDRKYKSDLLSSLKKEIITAFGENPENSEDLARIINLKHFNRVKRLIPDSKVFYGGESEEADLYIAPTILQDINWEDDIMKEEIFGPLLPVLSYQNIEEVIHQLKNKEKPLSLYVFSNKKSFVNKILNELSFGSGTINDTIIHYGNPYVPFGGVGQSGYGAYHGKYSFETFSHKKGIVKKGNWLDVPVRYAPFGTKLKWLKRLFKINFEW
jgi:aldehyde dehydrogenase (NAD+)